ncbi:MAG: hypothetical protein GYA85_05375 [Propionibacterium sp.]|nr:hypothetical protein [Propionibacterium sp.]
MTLQTPRPIASLRDIAAHPGLQPLLLQQARRGVVTQLAVRVVLAALVVITVLVLPSATQRVPSTALAFGYLAWSVALAGLAGPGARDVRAVSRAWPALLADLVAVTALTVVAGLEAVSWTATVLTYAFFVVPVLAATQLRPWLCAGVCVPTVAAYFAAGVVAREVNGDEPWASIVLRTAVLALVCAGAVASCRIQLARVIGLARLAADRIELAEQLLTIEERERRDLSEQLHDGAPMGVGARWSTSIAPPVLVMDAGTGRHGDRQRVVDAGRQPGAGLQGDVHPDHPALRGGQLGRLLRLSGKRRHGRLQRVPGEGLQRLAAGRVADADRGHGHRDREPVGQFQFVDQVGQAVRPGEPARHGHHAHHHRGELFAGRARRGGRSHGGRGDYRGRGRPGGATGQHCCQRDRRTP